DPSPAFTELLELDLSTIEPSLAGPRRPQDRVALGAVQQSFRAAYPERFAADISDAAEEGAPLPNGTAVTVMLNGYEAALTHGSVAIAAITSCTNTSNPSVMLAAGLLAKKAVERGLQVSPGVKTSLAPGSRAVTDYYTKAGLLPYLEALGFHVVGYGCTTCIARGTPVLLANGTTRRIEEMPRMGGTVLFGPTTTGSLGMAV